VKLGLTPIALAALLSSSLFLSISLSPSAAAQQQQPAVPDAPVPQAPAPLTGASGPITPGKGAGDELPGTTSSSSSGTQQQTAPSTPAPVGQIKDEIQTTPPELPAAGEGVERMATVIHLNVTFVEVPVTVKDSKGKLVPGLTWRDFKVYENDTREPLKQFIVDPFPLSIAFVIDQSLTSDVMAKVNNSLGAIQGALTPWDEVAVFSYSNGPQNRSGGFTGAQSARVPYVLSMTKETGTEMLVPVNSGPLSGCNIRENGGCVDPNLQPGRSAGSGSGVMTIPKEIHTLNDAILAAAKELSNRPKATYKEVLRYLDTNQITVYGTLVGDSARWGEGYISRIHLPFSMYDNLLYKYIAATGGAPDSERDLNGIEKSYAKIAEEARTQYTLVYASHESIYDSKFRKIDVRVDRPGLDVIARHGYYPSAQDAR